MKGDIFMIDKIKLFLFISLTVNAFLVGIVVSSYMTKPHHRPPPPRHGGMMFEQFQSAKVDLSPEGQAIVDAVLNEHAIHLKQNTQNIDGLRVQAESILLADSFQGQELQNIHDQMAENKHDAKHGVSKIIYDLAVQLSDKDRIQFFKKALPKGPPHHRRRER